MFKITRSNSNITHVEAYIMITTTNYITRVTTLGEPCMARYRARIKMIGVSGYIWGFSNKSKLAAFKDARNNLNVKIFESI